jgi:hypothetical protein
MMEMLDRGSVICEVTWEKVAEWMASIYQNMVGSRIIKNAWRKMGFDWFEGIGNDDDDDNANGDGDGDNNGDGNYYNKDNANVNFVFNNSKGKEDDIDEDVAEEGWDIVEEGGA